MRPATLLLRGLVHHRRANAAVVLGVATAVAVLAGALLVGESVRGSLRKTALERLGRTEHAVVGAAFFREDLAAELAARPGAAAAPLVALSGIVADQASGRRAGDVAVYGVDERFWSFHREAPRGLEGRDALVSAALARELDAGAGATLLLRVAGGSDIPGSSLFGRRDEAGRAIRLDARGVLPERGVGEFSLRPGQQDVRAVFVPLALLQRELGQEGRANTVILAGEPEPDAVLRRAARLEDLGLLFRDLPERGALSLESATAIVGDAAAGAARAAAKTTGLSITESLVYLANSIRVGDRSVPYSLVAGIDEGAWRDVGGKDASQAGRAAAPGGPAPPLLLGAWAAADLRARPGDRVTLEYYLWRDEGRLETRTADFTVAGVVPLSGLAADRDLVPDYPGITESPHLSDWDPPFPVDLERIRPKDEEYWERHRTTPKAFVPLATAQLLWGHRLGRLTTIRLTPAGAAGPADLEDARAAYAEALRAALDPARAGLRVEAVRARALEAARGATDFGAYFVYFSFFLVVAALLLAGLFFRLGLEQRLPELGLLRALGFSGARLHRLYLGEGLVLAGLGGLLGAVASALYAGLMVLGLQTLWVDAMGTRRLELHVTPGALAAGALGGVAAALLAVVITLRGLRGRSPRGLLSGAPEEWVPPGRVSGRAVAVVLLALAAALLGAAGLGGLSPTGGFFGAGSLLLAALLVEARRWLAAGGGAPPSGPAGLGLRSASYRPGRSVVCVALIAFAAFVIVAVAAFRHEGAPDVSARDSEAGGYPLFARSLLPLYHDPATPEGRAALGLPDEELAGVGFARFRMRAGEDASCLNLYRPDSPTVLAPTEAFRREGRFAFQAVLADTPEERANPWLLLDREAPDGALPVVADAGSLAYVLHKAVGETMTLGGTDVTVRFVAALRPGLFQGELLMGERDFQRAFPHEEGYRFFLVEAPAVRMDEVTQALESRLGDFGFDVGSTAERLAAYHRVENTYIATFQTLGGLGLVLGTVGLAAVLLRNAFEQRRELALLRAVGYRERHISAMVMAENLLLLLLGLGAGTVAALVAIAPALRERAGQVPFGALGGLLLAVVVTGLLVSRLAVRAIQRLPVLSSLRSE